MGQSTWGCQCLPSLPCHRMVLHILILSLASLSLVEGHTKGTDGYAYFDAHKNLGGTTCNAQRPVTGWTVVKDRWVAADKTVTNNAQFSNGIYTTKVAGVYHCCASFRCKQGGVCDWTVIRNAGAGDIKWGAFGTRNTGNSNNGWASHSHCWTSSCQANVAWKLNFESGGGSDCIEETQWKYGRFTCFLATPL